MNVTFWPLGSFVFNLRFAQCVCQTSTIRNFLRFRAVRKQNLPLKIPASTCEAGRVREVRAAREKSVELDAQLAASHCLTYDDPSEHSQAW